MPRNTSVTLGDHFSTFVDSKIREGRFGSTSEAVRAGLRLLETEETKLEALRAAIQEGINSGMSDRGPEDVRREVRQRLRDSGQLPAE